MDWIEQLQSGSGTHERNGAKTDERYFSVWNANPRSVVDSPASITNTAGIALPAVGSAHPVNGSLRLDRYGVSRNGVILNLTAMYSNDGRFQASPQQAKAIIDEPAVYSASFRRSEIMMPYARKARITLPTAEGVEVETADVWELDELPDDTELHIIEYQATFAGNQFAAGVEAMRKQARKIHKIGDRFYRFQSGNVRQNKDGTYTTTYSWEYDPGIYDGVSTSVLIGTGGSAVLAFPVAIESIFGAPSPGLLNSWHRPPFHLVIPYRATNNATYVPLFEARLNGIVDYNGWQTLPGMVVP